MAEDRINVLEMAGLCCVHPRVIQRWCADGSLKDCHPIKEYDRKKAEMGRFAEYWTMLKEPALRFAEKYKECGLVTE